MMWNQNKEERIIHLLVQSVCIAVYCVKLSEGQNFNLTGSPETPVFGEAFTWTCEAFVPPGETSVDVFFYRYIDEFSYPTGLVAVIGSECYTYGGDPRYIYKCLSKSTFTLTIPAENMTEYEQNSIWSCGDVLYRSPEVILNIESLGPPYVPPNLQRYYYVIENTNLSVNCGAADRNATSVVSWEKSGDNLFQQNGTTLELIHTLRNSSGTYYCIAENFYSNGQKETAWQFNKIDVLYEPSVSLLSNQTIIEGEDLSVTCNVTAGYPRYSLVFWTKTDDPSFRFNGTTVRLSRIQRSSSGTYRCTAENYYNNLGKGTSSRTMFVNVLYPPTVYTFDNQRIIEGGNLSATCSVVPGNPSSFIVYWTKLDNSLCRQDGAMLQLPNIQRNSSGIYVCTAKNYYNDSYMGVANHSMDVDVLWKPDKPTNIEAACLVTKAKVRWTSSSDGGSKQTFTVTSLNDGHESGWSSAIPDRGFNIIHETYIGNLRQSTFYEFYVSAQNRVGTTISNRTSCTTMTAPSTEVLSYEAKIAIGSSGGALVFTAIVVLAIVIVRRYKCSCMIEFRRKNKEVKEAATKEENENHYEELTDITRRHIYQSLDVNNGKHVYENPQSLPD